ncbi:ZIP family metal transporter [Acidimicrobiia bacterium EGI L10123]|uniref:ZIP family metal transporter n=1 Tax=Salinilacustrithrix flava TaxID=2957203 RepID=UPI003D7C2297|nr:ZIP family metal transporter [Acidimicrobiia bacterium EGI L10123]
MSTLSWIIGAGVAMSALALTGSLTLVLPAETFKKLVLPLVALAAGSLLGGALFHMLPESVEALGNDLTVWAWVAGGLFSFFVLEQLLHWHHCHRPVTAHRPLGYMILVADGLHNLIGGLAVGSAFVLDHRVGIVTWLVAAAHEVPQELGDFGILVHSGWDRRRALLFNVLSALTFLAGGLIAYGVSGRLDVAFLVPFAAGNFIYIAATDLLPEITTSPTAGEKAVLTAGFATGLLLLFTVALIA